MRYNPDLGRKAVFQFQISWSQTVIPQVKTLVTEVEDTYEFQTIYCTNLTIQNKKHFLLGPNFLTKRPKFVNFN